MPLTSPPPVKSDGQVIPASVDNTLRQCIIELQQRHLTGAVALRHTPSGITDVADGPANLAVLSASLAVPDWATKAIVDVSVSTLTWASTPATHLLRVAIGSAVSSYDAIIASEAVRRPLSWVSEVSGIAPGVRSVAVQALRQSGGSIRTDTGSIWTARITFTGP